ncbi:hypothetical protein JB92DRAFT_3094813 [Gautieria morchelliformis]|nr:hypothetical protein JB92DRAFT_3094813 [Gautieria morchelliformis]
MNNLALEIIDDIIGHVDAKDYDIDPNYPLENEGRSHLRACSLVSRLWLPLSQRRLFHSIMFCPWVAEIHAKVQRLDHVLHNSPHLANYIRVLEIPSMASYLPPTELRDPSIALDKPLSSLLRKVTRVQKLKIAYLPWDVLPGDFRQSLCRVLELPSMAFVVIYNAQFTCMDDFTNFIYHVRGLMGLSLSYIDTSWVPPQSLQAEDNKEKFERHRISHLTRLDMMEKDNSVILNWLLGPRSHLDVSHIHTLHIHLSPEPEDDSVNRLLCAIGSSLKHVYIILTCEQKSRSWSIWHLM